MTLFFLCESIKQRPTGNNSPNKKRARVASYQPRSLICGTCLTRVVWLSTAITTGNEGFISFFFYEESSAEYRNWYFSNVFSSTRRFMDLSIDDESAERDLLQSGFRVGCLQLITGLISTVCSNEN